MLKEIFSITNEMNKKVIKIFGIKIKFSKFKLQKIKVFKNNKPTIAFQLNEMDKGGLEEVVLQLATSKDIREKYNTVIISEYTNKGYLADVARKFGVPVYSFFKNTKNIPILIKTLNIKIVHFNYNISGIEEYKNYAVKTLYTIHNNYIWLNKEDVALRSKFYQYVDKFIAVSSQVKEYFCEKFNIDKSRVLVIPNGIQFVETDNLVPFSKTEVGFNKNDFVLINVASFNPNKYHFTQLKVLAEITKKYKNVKLLLIGNIHDQLYYQKIKEMIAELDIDNNVKILDFVPKMDIYKYLKMADCFIMTSLTEGFSIAMSEAMMLGKPMVLTDVGGARDVIKDNDIGIIVSHAFNNIQNVSIWKVIEEYKKNNFYFDNVEEILLAVENMYLNKDKWIKNAKIGIERAKILLNLNRVIKQYLDIYEEVNND